VAADTDAYQESDHAHGDYVDFADQYTELDERDGASEPPDLWGDTDPDAANYPDVDGQSAAHPDERESPDQGDPIPARDVSVDADQRISALEAKNSDTTQKLADAEQKIANLEAKNDALTARLDRYEQLQADSGRVPGPDSGQDRTAGQQDAGAESQDVEKSKIAAREASDEGMDTKETDRTHWRRAASSVNVGIVGAAITTADTLAQFATHSTPDALVNLGAAAFGLASLGLAKAEEKRKGREKT
jgi:hypothetical protein